MMTNKNLIRFATTTALALAINVCAVSDGFCMMDQHQDPNGHPSPSRVALLKMPAMSDDASSRERASSVVVAPVLPSSSSLAVAAAGASEEDSISDDPAVLQRWVSYLKQELDLKEAAELQMQDIVLRIAGGMHEMGMRERYNSLVTTESAERAASQEQYLEDLLKLYTTAKDSASNILVEEYNKVAEQCNKLINTQTVLERQAAVQAATQAAVQLSSKVVFEGPFEGSKAEAWKEVLTRRSLSAVQFVKLRSCLGSPHDLMNEFEAVIRQILSEEYTKEREAMIAQRKQGAERLVEEARLKRLAEEERLKKEERRRMELAKLDEDHKKRIGDAAANQKEFLKQLGRLVPPSSGLPTF